MPVLCPKCIQPVPPEDVNVAKDVAFCRACNEAFALSSVVAAQSSGPVRYPQPANTKAVLTQDAQHIALMLPPGGFKGIGCFFAIFAGFWNLVTWGVFAGFVAAMFQPNPDFPAFALLFFIPHMLIGLVTGVIALYHIFGDLAVAMDKNGVMMQRKLLGYTWTRKMPLADMSAVRLESSHSVNKRPVFGVGFIFENTRSTAAGSTRTARPMIFGSGLSDEEKNWLVGEFDAFFQQHRPRG
jgi:hypothetical protein